MKKIVWVYLLSLVVLNKGWCTTTSSQIEDQIDEEVLQHSVDPDETENEKFSDLVKSTMDLLGPEMSQEESKTETVSQATP